MHTQTIELGGQPYTYFISNDVIIDSAQAVLQVVFDYETNKIIMHEHNIHADFFNLRTGLAGEIMQKFANYTVYAVIIGDFARYESKALRDFMYESNYGKKVMFVPSLDHAKQILG